MNELMNLSQGQKFLNKVKKDIIKEKNFRLKMEQGLNYINDHKSQRVADLPLVSFTQKNPQPQQKLVPESIVSNDSQASNINDLEKNEHFHFLDGPTNWVGKVLPTKNLANIFCCGNEKLIYKWTLKSHNYHLDNFASHEGIVYDIILNKEESILFSSSKDKTIKVWSTKNGALLKKLDFSFEVIRIILNHDESGLIVGGIQGQIELVDLNSDVRKPLEGHKSVVRDLVLVSEGTLLVSCSQDSRILLWNLNTLECIEKGTSHDKEVFSLAVSSNEEILYSCGNEDRVISWHLKRLSKIEEVTIPGLGSCLKLSPSDNRLYVGLQSGEILVHDTNKLTLLKKMVGHSDRVTSIWLNNSQSIVLASSRDKTIKFWEQQLINESMRNFNFNTKRGNLFSVDLSNEAVVVGPILYKPVLERPESYTLTLTDDFQNEIWKINLKPASFKETQVQENLLSTIKVRFEDITEYKATPEEVENIPALYRDFKYSSRTDDGEFDDALTFTKLTKKSISKDQRLEWLIERNNIKKPDRIEFIKNFDLNGNFAAQMKNLLDIFDDRIFDQDQDYRVKIHKIGEKVSEILNSETILNTFSMEITQAFENQNPSFERIGQKLAYLINSEKEKANFNNFMTKILAYNPLIHCSFVKGTFLKGVLNGQGTKIDEKNLLMKGNFKDGLLHGLGTRVTEESILCGSFNNGVLENKPYYIMERNGLTRIADEFGVINKLCLRGVVYQAKDISETYEGAAFITFSDGTCFTSVIKNLRLVNDVINNNIVFYYGPEKKSYVLVYEVSTCTLKENNKSVFRINWENGQILKV